MYDLKSVERILDIFQKHGHTEVSLFRYCVLCIISYPDVQVDTARAYTGGTSEEFLGEIGWQKRGLKLETKLYPNVVSWSTIRAFFSARSWRERIAL